MHRENVDLTTRLERLEIELRNARRDIEQLRRRRRYVSSFAVPTLALGLVVGSHLGLNAQGGSTSGRFVAPFEVVNGAGKTIARIAERSPGSGQPVLTLGSDDAGGAALGVGNSGAGFLIVRRADGKDGATIGQLQGAPMALRFPSADGTKTTALLGLDPRGQGFMSVGDDDTGGVAVGRGASGVGFLIVRRADGKDGASLGQPQGAPMALRVNGTDGTPAATLGLTTAARGVLNLGSDTAGGVRISIGDSGAGFVLVRAQTGKDGVSLGQFSGGPLGVRVHDAAGAKTLAELSRDATGAAGAVTVSDSTAKPILRVTEKLTSADARVGVGNLNGSYGVFLSNTAGTQIGAFGEAKIGGGVMAVHNSSGVIRALVSGTGQVHVADSDGTTMATIVADAGQGALSVRNKSGATIARLGQGQVGGLLQLADAAGNAMVEGGVLPGGQGLVRAYPLGSPGAGLVGMPGTFILGRK